MRGLKIIVITVLVFVSAFLTLAVLSPTKYKVERSIIINASKNKIYQNINNLKGMQSWFPFSIQDSNVNIIYGLEDKILRGEREDKVIVVEQELKLVAKDRVEVELRFYKPKEFTNHSFIQLDEVEGGFKVTLGVNGENSFPSNAVMALFSMNEILGSEIEKGLKKLKLTCETEKSDQNISISTFKSKVYVSKRSIIPFDSLSSFFGNKFPYLINTLMKEGLEITGKPTSIIFSEDKERQMMDVEAALPVIIDVKKITNLK